MVEARRRGWCPRMAPALLTPGSPQAAGSDARRSRPCSRQKSKLPLAETHMRPWSTCCAPEQLEDAGKKDTCRLEAAATKATVAQRRWRSAQRDALERGSPTQAHGGGEGRRAARRVPRQGARPI